MYFVGALGSLICISSLKLEEFLKIEANIIFWVLIVWNYYCEPSTGTVGGAVAESRSRIQLFQIWKFYYLQAKIRR